MRIFSAVTLDILVINYKYIILLNMLSDTGKGPLMRLG